MEKLKWKGLYIIGSYLDTKIQSAKTGTNALLQLPTLPSLFIEAGNDDVTTLLLYNSETARYLLVNKI